MKAEIAVNRFGFGAKPGEIARASYDPVGYLLSGLLPVNLTSSPSSLTIAKKLKQLRERDKKETGSGRKYHRQMYQTFAINILHQAVTAEHSFLWRMLDFFSNHFSVTAQGPLLTATAGTLEVEAIAPNLLGNFTQMLLAVSRHPVMLNYLNNEKSFGPESKLGKRGKGLNENLAREILELHTLGVKAGYSQQDVIALAKGISGWSIHNPDKAEKTLFVFRQAGHQPGSQQLLNQLYKQKGESQGIAMLEALAAHPATAKHLSFKLARHLVSDTPPAPLVKALEQTWLTTSGDLKAVYTTLIKHPLAWQPSAEKFKTPREFLISTYRAVGSNKFSPRFVLNSLRNLGQQPLKAGSPAGYEDSASFWNNGYAILARANWISQIAGYVKQDIRALAKQILAAQLTENTEQMIRRAESRPRALSLLLLSPEFMRR